MTTKKTTEDAALPDPDRVDELRDEAIRAIEEKVAALGKAIQKHPLLAVGIGFGAGYVVARLLHRD